MRRMPAEIYPLTVKTENSEIFQIQSYVLVRVSISTEYLWTLDACFEKTNHC